jgi:hypothetical protein
MANAADNVHESGRKETIDYSSGGPAKTGNHGHLSSYVGLAIATMILVAMVVLQSTVRF